MPMVEYLIVCPLVFIAGFIDAIAGGGGLISLPAYLIAGLPPHMAIGTNKFSSCIGTTVTTWHYARCGFIHWRRVAPAIVTALIGSALGANITLWIDNYTIKQIMLFVLPLTGFFVVKCNTFHNEQTPFAETKTMLIVTALSFFVGIYDGAYGPGTGTFLMLLLTAVAHMSLNEAAGTTKVINLSTNIAALAVFLHNGVVVFPLAIAATLFGVAGNYIGARFFTRRGATFARPIILFVLAVFFIKILWELVNDALL